MDAVQFHVCVLKPHSQLPLDNHGFYLRGRTILKEAVITLSIERGTKCELSKHLLKDRLCEVIVNDIIVNGMPAYSIVAKYSIMFYRFRLPEYVTSALYVC